MVETIVIVSWVIEKPYLGDEIWTNWTRGQLSLWKPKRIISFSNY